MAETNDGVIHVTKAHATRSTPGSAEEGHNEDSPNDAGNTRQPSHNDRLVSNILAYSDRTTRAINKEQYPPSPCELNDDHELSEVPRKR